MTGDETRDRTPTSWILIAALPVAIGTILQRFGQIVYLARLERVMDPFRMIARGFDLWFPYWDMGTVNYQQNGYWLPFDTWFAATKVMHVPIWLSERLFITVMITVALWGFVRLADALRIGTPASRVAAGWAYALSPAILCRIGWQSPYAMGAIFLPWVLLPLVRAAESGSPRRGAFRSAVAVALIGGSNAAVTFAILPVPALYLITRAHGPRRRGLIMWWVIAIPMAILWWFVGLILLAKYGPDILKYTETARDTTGPTQLAEALRGAADWVGHLPSSFDPAGSSISIRPVPIIATAIVTGIGLAGLATKNLKERRFLVFTLLFGVAAVGGGAGGLFGNPMSSGYQNLLDGPLAAFRNVFKFQPLVSLPIALGVAHLLPSVLNFSRTVQWRVLKFASTTVALSALILAAFPIWTNAMTRGPGADAIPSAWREANDWLTQNSQGRVLILPGTPKGDFQWGSTDQIPIQWGSDISWATRSQAPLSGAKVIEYLDAAEAAIERGGDAGLPRFLKRGGFTSVLVANDVNTRLGASLLPNDIRDALVASGFERAVGFGDAKYGDGGLQQIEIYSVPGGERVSSYAVADTTWLSGDIGTALALPNKQFSDVPYLLVRDGNSSMLAPKQWLITDGNQATKINPYVNRGNRSYVHDTSNAVKFAGQSVSDMTVQYLKGFKSITASSVGGPRGGRPNRPFFDPAHVLDGNPESVWAPSKVQEGGAEAWGEVDPFVEINFEAPTQLSNTQISLLVGDAKEGSKIDLTVETDAGEATTSLNPVSTSQDLRVPVGITSRIRVTIARKSYEQTGSIIGIREINLPGTPVRPRLMVPSQLTSKFNTTNSPSPVWAFTKSRFAVSPFSSVVEETEISRGFTVPRPLDVEPVVYGSPTRSDALLDFLNAKNRFSIKADSTWGQSPNAAPWRLVDKNPDTAWRSDRIINKNGGHAEFALRWSSARQIDSVRLVRGAVDATPDQVEVTVGGNPIPSAYSEDGAIHFDAITTKSLRIKIEYAPLKDSDIESPRTMGFTSIEIPSVSDLYPEPIDPSTSYTESCAEGPRLTINSHVISYSVHATIGDLLDGKLLRLSPCTNNKVQLRAGTALLDTDSRNSKFSIDKVILAENSPLADSVQRERKVTITKWGTNNRTLEVSSGAESLITTNEAYNLGWEAQLDGTKLQPIEIDGWRQAFIVPEGRAGVVELVYAPDRIFKLGTLFGLAILLFVFVLALWPVKKIGALAPCGEGRTMRPILYVSFITGALWCTGIGALMLIPINWVRRRHFNWLKWFALIAMVISAGLVAIGEAIVDYESRLWGTDSYPVAAMASLSLLSVLAATVQD